jgi:hypothetical protein
MYDSLIAFAFRCFLKIYFKTKLLNLFFSIFLYFYNTNIKNIKKLF